MPTKKSDTKHAEEGKSALNREGLCLFDKPNLAIVGRFVKCIVP
jgi:hypothetical protein